MIVWRVVGGAYEPVLSAIGEDIRMGFSIFSGVCVRDCSDAGVWIYFSISLFLFDKRNRILFSDGRYSDGVHLPVFCGEKG